MRARKRALAQATKTRKAYMAPVRPHAELRVTNAFAAHGAALHAHRYDPCASTESAASGVQFQLPARRVVSPCSLAGLRRAERERHHEHARYVFFCVIVLLCSLCCVCSSSSFIVCACDRC